jgi:hypothetical protein
MLVLSSGAGAQPARNAASAATVQMKFAVLPWGTGVLARPNDADQQRNWDKGTDGTTNVPAGDDVTLSAALDPDPNDLRNLKSQTHAADGRGASSLPRAA